VVKVSVIVPVYNPGRNINDCIRSLLGQSLPPEEYEVIFVDDGSTDETPARLDELAAQHRHVRVEHIPNSGWPGRPRNVGLELARGEYVYFVDNDDWLGRRALERLHTAALRNESDVVIGKVVGHGKTVPVTLFRRNRREVKLDWPPLLRLLTPHKLFRKALLDEHGIRFPEGRRRLEDHVFVVHAYFHAARISVIADYPCYYWMLRDASASWRPFDPGGYFENVREVLDIVERHTEPGPLRDQMYAHWYRSKMLSRVGGGPFVRREPEYRRELYEEIRRLALERYGPDVETFLPFNLRVRSRLLREGDYESLGVLASFENELAGDVTVREMSWTDHTLSLELQATFAGDYTPDFLLRGPRWLWQAPEQLAERLSDDDLDATKELTKGRVELLLHSPADQAQFAIQADTELVMLPANGTGGAKRPALIAQVEVDPHKAAAGARIREGDWEVRAVVDVAGFTATTVVMNPGREGRFPLRPLPRRQGGPLTLTAMRDGQLRTRRPFVKRYLARRLPKLARLLRRAREGAGATAPV